MMLAHFNRIDCIGTIYELNIKIDPTNDTLCLKGSIVIKYNDNYIRFYINTPKYNSLEYYRTLETIGIKYEMISKYDKDKYTLHEELAQGILGGKIMDKFNIDSNNPTKVYLTGSITEYGYKMHHISRIDMEDMLVFNIDGSLYNDSKFIIPSIDNMISIESDINYQEDKYTRYKLCVEHNSGYNKVKENIISNIRKPNIKLNSIKKIGRFDKKMIDDIVILTCHI